MSVSWVDGVTLTFEVGYGSTVFTESPPWTDETAYLRGFDASLSSRSTEWDQFQPGIGSFTLDDRTRRFDASYGPASVALNGSSGNYWSAGDLAAFAGASELDLRVAVALTDWTPGTASTLLSQYGAAGQRSWSLDITTSGYLQLVVSSNGTATTTTDSGVPVGTADGKLFLVRATWENSAGAVTYYVKHSSPRRARADCADDAGWTQVGAVDTGMTASTLHNSTSAVRLGSRADGTQYAAGTFYYAQAATTIAGAVACAFWPGDAASAAATSWTSSVGASETWSGSGSWTLLVQGPHFDHLVPGTPVRLTATYSGTDYRLFYGYVTRWPHSYPAIGVDSVVTLIAADALAWLARKPAPDSPYGIAMEIDRITFSDPTKPGAYWPLHEPYPSTAFADAWGDAGGYWSNAAAAGGVSQPASTAPTRIQGAVRAVANRAPTIADGPGVFYSPTLAFWVYLPNESAQFRIFAGLGDGPHLGMCYGVDDLFYMQSYWPTAWDEKVTLVGRLAPGAHHISIANIGGTTIYYVDGVAGSLGGYSDGAAVVDTTNYPGLYLDGINATVSDVTFGMEVGLESIAAGSTGRSLDTSGERMTWLLTAAGIPAALQDVTTDVSTYLGPSTAGGSYAQLCRDVETAEGGRLFVAGDGKVTFRSFLWAGTASAATTSQGTFGDAAGEVPYSSIVIDAANIDDITNSATVSIANGAAGVARDATSIAAYGESSTSRTAPLASTGDAANLAARLVAGRAHPTSRVEQLTITRGPSTMTPFPQVLARKIGERITVKRRPNSTETISAEVTIEGIRHVSNAADATWTTTWNTAPAPPTAAEAGWWTVEDTVLGVIDSGVSVP